MLAYLPKFVSERAITAYFISLILCQLIFHKYLLPFDFMFIGGISAVGFFYFGNLKTQEWQRLLEKTFVKRVFWIALALRIAWVVFSYYYYILKTGMPFEFDAADSLAYHDGGQEVMYRIQNGSMGEWEMLRNRPSDAGYMLILGIEYLFFGSEILLVPRIIKAVLSAFVVVLIYRIAKNNFGEKTGRMAAVFTCFMPHFIYYCGLHQKEMEMIFLAVWFVERMENMIRNKKIKLLPILYALLIVIILFMFRTVLAVVAILSILITFFLSNERKTNWGNRLIGIVCVLIFVGFMFGSKFMEDVITTWENRDRNQVESMEWRSKREGGNIFAQYGRTAIFAPIIFTIPFSSMLNIPQQENIMLMNGSNFIKNIMSFFTIMGLFMLVYKKEWRRHLLILSFMLGYLAVIAMSGFAQSERFHLPAVPFEVIIMAYGLSQFTNKQKTMFNYWICAIVAAEISWNYIKLRGRGM